MVGLSVRSVCRILGIAERLAGIAGPRGVDGAAGCTVLVVVGVNGRQIVGGLLFVELSLGRPSRLQSISFSLSLISEIAASEAARSSGSRISSIPLQKVLKNSFLVCEMALEQSCLLSHIVFHAHFYRLALGV